MSWNRRSKSWRQSETLCCPIRCLQRYVFDQELPLAQCLFLYPKSGKTPCAMQEFVADLKKLSETGERGQQWLCDTYGAIAEHTSTPAVLTVGLEVATILLSVPNTARHALRCISSSIRAFYRVSLFDPLACA